MVGGLRASTFSCLIMAAFFSSGVTTFFFDFGFGLAFVLAFVFFVAFRPALFPDFGVDFVLGILLGAEVSAIGFLAAFVFDVVGAFLADAVALPVWAFGLDTGFVVVAYAREGLSVSVLTC